MPAILNAANEISVNAFLEKKIGFGEIARINAGVICSCRSAAADTIESVIEADDSARETARRLVAEAASEALAAWRSSTDITAALLRLDSQLPKP